MSLDKKWGFARKEAEYFHGEEDTRQAAIASGTKEYDGESFQVGQFETVYASEFYPDVDTVLEIMGDRAHDNSSEFSEGWPSEPTQEAKDELDSGLQDLLNAWTEKHDLKPSWYSVRNVEVVNV